MIVKSNEGKGCCNSDLFKAQKLTMLLVGSKQT